MSNQMKIPFILYISYFFFENTFLLLTVIMYIFKYFTII